jgi:glycosyltransferase involved in cell wall biosynthesis
MAIKGWLFILPWSPDAIGGINRVVIELCRAMKLDGHYQPIILVLDWLADKPVVIEKMDYIEIRCRLRVPSNEIKALMSFIVSLPRTLILLSNILSKYRIAVVNPHNPILSTVYFVLLRLIKVNFRLFISVHGADLKGLGGGGRIEKRLWKWIINRADAIVACSKGLADNFIALFPEAESKTIYIHNGISADFLSSEPNSARINILPQQYLLSVGTFEHKKGQDLLIAAFAIIAAQFPDLSLVLIGRSSDTLTLYKQQALHAGLEQRIIFFEDIPPDDISDFYRHASLYVSSSRDEPFGIVMLEAAAAGIPVLATRTLGAMEIIGDGVDGMLVPVDDVDALAQGITDLLNDRHKCKIYSKALKEKVIRKFTWKNALVEYMSLTN